MQTNNTAYFDYTVLQFTYDPDSCIEWPMRTTNEAAFRAGLWLDHLIYSKTDFDLRFMGVIYGLIFFGGFVTLQRALRHVSLQISILAQTVWIVVVCNAVYVPMFNTLYFDALSIATLTGALASLAVVALRKPLTAGPPVVAALWLAVLAGSKGQHAPLALMCIPALWVPWNAVPRRILAARALGTMLILSAAWLSMSTMPRFYQGKQPSTRSSIGFFPRFTPPRPTCPKPVFHHRGHNLPVKSLSPKTFRCAIPIMRNSSANGSDR